MPARNSFADVLAQLTVEGELGRRTTDNPDDQTVQCQSCAHGCRIPPGGHGICQVRLNRGGRLLVPSGYVSSLACDPIEKKPFYHFLAGQNAFSFGMLGCNLHCPFCQNWHISQTLRDPQAAVSPRRCTAEKLVELAVQRGAPVISSTYNEPLITAEWSAAVFRLARQQGLRTCYVSNGFASVQVLEYLRPCLDAMNVDLKCFTEDGYSRTLGGHLQPVLDTIRWLYRAGVWVEVITLLVPGFNDSPDELKRAADFLVSVSPDVPWHVTAYHADYKMTGGPQRTPSGSIHAAAEIGRGAGLRYVYAGNLSSQGEDENTRCHNCRELLIERTGFYVSSNRIRNGACPSCGTAIPGRWTR